MIIPDGLRLRASRDAGAAAWVRSLPSVCRRLARLWQVRLGPAFPECNVSLVAPVDGAAVPAVVKIPMPTPIEVGTLAGDCRDREAAALRLWSGVGAPELLEIDPESGALLIERCSPGLSLATVTPAEAADEVWASLMTQLHRPVIGVAGIDRLSDRARALARSLPGRVSQLASRPDPGLTDRAAVLLSELAGPSDGDVLLHGDPHHHNILSSTRTPWLAVDPLPMIGDPAYDAVQYLLFRKGDLADPGTAWPSVIDRVCRLADLDPARVRAWIFARLVSDAVAAAEQGTTVDELEARHGDLWTARLLRD